MSALQSTLNGRALSERKERFNRLAGKNFLFLKRWASSLLSGSNPGYLEAEDLVQETLLKAWLYLDMYDEKSGKFQAWLVTILKNVFINYLRKAKAQKRNLGAQAVGEKADFLLENAPSGENVDEDVIGSIVSRDICDRVLGQVPEPYRISIILYGLEGKTYEEIAEICGVAMGTVKSRIHRGRQILRNALEQDGKRLVFSGKHRRVN